MQKNQGFLFLFLFGCSTALAAVPPAVLPAQPAEFSLFEEIPKVTSASRMEESILEAPAAISVITSEDLERRGTVDLPDAFRFVPGMDVTAFTERDFGVTARGFNDRYNSRMLVLIDDMSVYLPISSGISWANLALINEDIDSIEVVRGPNDVLYGFNAFNGVINVKTKDPKDTHGFYSKYIWGSNERNKVVTRYGDSVKLWGRDLDYRFTYSFDGSGGYAQDDPDKGFGNMQDWRRLQLFTSRSKYTISERLNAEALFGVNYGAFGRNNLNSTPSFQSDEGFNFQQFRLNAEISDTNKASLQFYRWSQTEDPDMTVDGLNVLDTKQDEYDLQFVNNFSLWDERSQTVWGGNLRFHRGRQLLIRGFDGVRQWTNDTLYSFFFNEKYTLLKDLPAIHKLTAVFGLRGEGSLLIPEPEWAPRASILYEPVQDHVFRATYARGYRLPAFIEKFYSLQFPATTGAFYRLQGNDLMESETVDSYELGYSTNLLEGRLQLDADIYIAKYQNLKNIKRLQTISFFPVAQPTIDTFINEMEADSFGVELEQKFKISPSLDVYTNYTYESIQDDFNSSVNAPYAPVAPQHKANFGVHWRPAALDGFSFNLNLNFRSSYSIFAVEDQPTTRTEIQPNLRTDVRIAKTLFNDDAEVAFSVQNLTGQDHSETKYLPVPRVYYVTLTFRDWPWEVLKNKNRSKAS